jgi:hypothetical protein
VRLSCRWRSGASRTATALFGDRRGVDRRESDSRPADDRAHSRDPRYGFDRHKGYATADHLDAVARFGYRMFIVDRSGLPRCLIRLIRRPSGH